MRRFYLAHKATLDKTFFIGAVIVSVVVFFKFFFDYVAPFFVAFIISLLLEPLIVLLMTKGRFKRAAASVVCLILCITVIGGLGTMLVTKLTKEIGAFVAEAPLLIEEYGNRIDDVNSRLLLFADGIPESFGFDITAITDAVVNTLLGMFGDGFKNTSVRLVSNVPMFFVTIIMGLVAAFFFMKDKPLIYSAMVRYCPEWLARNFRLVRRGLTRAARGYFKAQFILMAIVGTISIAGLLIIGNPYALLVGLMIAVLDFLPIVGSGSVLLPWAIISLLAGHIPLAISLLVLYGVITVTRQSLEPKILGEQIGLHPLVTLMSVFIGLKIFGFFGIVIGPSLVIILKAIYEAEEAAEQEPDISA